MWWETNSYLNKNGGILPRIRLTGIIDDAKRTVTPVGRYEVKGTLYTASVRWMKAILLGGHSLSVVDIDGKSKI